MPTFALAAAGAGLLSALFHALLLTGSLSAFLLAYLAQLPLFLIGLWVGVGGAALAALIAIVALAVAGGFVFALAYVAANAAPAVIMTGLAQLNRRGADGRTEWYPAGRLLVCLVSLSAAAFLAVFVALSGEPGGAQGAVRSFLESGLRGFTAGEIDSETLARTASAMAHFFPGMVAGSWMAMVIGNAVLAQGVLVRLGRNFRPSPKMADIDLPTWMLAAVAIALFGTILPGNAGFVGGNLLLMLLLAYAMAGLGVIHALAARWPNRVGLLGVTYVLLFLFGWPLIIAALLGLAEPWLKLRHRAAGGPRT